MFFAFVDFILFELESATGRSSQRKSHVSYCRGEGDALKLKVPTKADWGDLKADPEVRYGYKKFGGKTIEEALSMFVDDPIERGAELRFSTVRVVDYYVFCYVNHLLSPASEGHSDVASVFIGLVLNRLERYPSQFEQVFDEIFPAVERVADEQYFFDADPNIYGSFSFKRDEILALRAKRCAMR